MPSAWGGLHIHDDPELNVDEIIVRIGEERWPSHRAGPLRGWIGGRDKFRRHLACRAQRECYFLDNSPCPKTRVRQLLTPVPSAADISRGPPPSRHWQAHGYFYSGRGYWTTGLIFRCRR